LCFGIRTGQEDDALMRWPPRSPDLTPYNFFLWGFVKDTVFVPPLPANLQDLRNRITATVALVSGVPRGVVWGLQTPPPRNSEDIGEVLDRVSKKNWRLDFLL